MRYSFLLNRFNICFMIYADEYFAEGVAVTDSQGRKGVIVAVNHETGRARVAWVRPGQFRVIGGGVRVPKVRRTWVGREALNLDPGAN